ncbi:MAG: hypothetical protein AAB461_01100 [Patescibacteria group bacterium]
MQFSIIRVVSYGKKKINGHEVNTMAAIVNLGTDEAPELATRHLYLTDGWVGKNSDQNLLNRKEIIGAYTYNKAVADGAEERIADLEAKANALKGKRGVAEERQRVNERLKIAKAAADLAKSNLNVSSEIKDKVDETNPEFVKFVF